MVDNFQVAIAFFAFIACSYAALLSPYVGYAGYYGAPYVAAPVVPTTRVAYTSGYYAPAYSYGYHYGYAAAPYAAPYATYAYSPYAAYTYLLKK